MTIKLTIKNQIVGGAREHGKIPMPLRDDVALSDSERQLCSRNWRKS
jgi:hypothetical protein